MTLALGGGMQLHAADRLADTLYRNGTIYTLAETPDEAKDVANAQKAEVVATLKGKIIFVGSESDAKAKGYFDKERVGRIVDLRGKTLLPGFVDGHGHFPGESEMDLFSVNLNCPPLGSVLDMDDLVALLKTKAENTAPGEWVTGQNYDDSLIAEKRHPNRDDLDRVSTRHPVVAFHSSFHMQAVNSYFIENLLMPLGSVVDGVFTLKDGTKVTGVEIEGGRPTGMLYEAAMYLVPQPSHSPADTMQTYARGTQTYAAAGVTTADQGGLVFAGELTNLQKSLGEGNLGVRVIMHPYTAPILAALGSAADLNHKALKWNTNGTEDYLDDAPSAETPAIGDDVTRMTADGKDLSSLPQGRLFLGAWKEVYDGSNQGYTGYFKHPGYWDKAGKPGNDPSTGKPDPNAPEALLGLGTLNLSRDVFRQSVDFYHKHGQPIEVHTNGSMAAEDFMTALELAVAAHPEIKDMRHTFIHGQMEERQMVERAVGDYSQLDATAGMYEDLTGTARQSGVERAVNGKEYTASDLRAALKDGRLMRDQNLVSSYFINHAYFWGDRHLDIYMGPGRGKQMNPCGWAVYYGHPFTTHNDCSVTPISPLRSTQSAVTRVSTGGALVSGSSRDIDAKALYPETKGGSEREFWDYDQRVNALQALHATTIVPAYQNHIERLVGSLEEGKFADFVILDKDPLRVAEAEPLTIADMRVAATIVGDDVVHGILPDADAFIGKLGAGYGQAEGVSVSGLSSRAVSHEEAAKKYGAIGKGENRLGTLSFTADVTEGKSGVFQFTFLGNGASAADFKLYKLHENDTTLYAYGKPAPEALDSASGQWWITDLKSPTVPLAAQDTLERDKTYIAFFVIRDNDAAFDADPASGVIKDPLSLTTTGPLPDNGGTARSDNGGGSSGCTVGGTPSYDLFILFLGFAAVVAIRALRRKEAA